MLSSDNLIDKKTEITTSFNNTCRNLTHSQYKHNIMYIRWKLEIYGSKMDEYIFGPGVEPVTIKTICRTTKFVALFI